MDKIAKEDRKKIKAKCPECGVVIQTETGIDVSEVEYCWECGSIFDEVYKSE